MKLIVKFQGLKPTIYSWWDFNSVKYEVKEWRKKASQENKIIRSSDSGLNDEAIDAKMMLSEGQTKLNLGCKTFDSLVDNPLTGSSLYHTIVKRNSGLIPMYGHINSFPLYRVNIWLQY